MRQADPSLRVEAAREADLAAVTAIYEHHVVTGTSSFDLEGWPLARWRRVRAELHPAAGHHLLVARRGEAVVGWAKSGEHRAKPAYATSVETSVYVAPTATGTGVGSALYRELLGLLPLAGVHRAYAGIAQPNPASVALHERHGFRHIGTFNEVGRKFDRWWDVAWFERAIPGPAR